MAVLLESTVLSKGVDVTLKIAVLWSHLPGYAYACITELSAMLGDNLWYASLGPPPCYLTAGDSLKRPTITIFSREGNAQNIAENILQQLNAFQPQVFLATGWALPAVRFVAQHLKRRGVLTVCMADTPWLGKVRQIIRCVAGRWLLHQCYDALFVPGACAVPVAHLAGFSGPRLWQNLYSGDTQTFSALTETRLEDARSSGSWPQRFLFVGRLAPEKNITGLVAAYRDYRDSVSRPWPLYCIGDGPLREFVEKTENAVCLGWAEPARVAAVMAESGCLILPSTYEPWGVVVHEAACAGLPLILSRDVGAGADLMRDGYNGRFIDANDPVDFANGLRWVAAYPKPWLLGMRSYEMSRQFSPALWSANVIQKASELLARRAHGHFRQQCKTYV